MQIGCHVSSAGSIDKSIDRALELGCSAFQIFTRSPRSWYAKELEKEEIKNFKIKLEKSGIDRFSTTAHMPYLPNLSSPSDELFKKSVKTLVEEVERCGVLGIPYIVAHLGSHMGSGEKNGIKKLVEAFTKAGKVKNDVRILLENTAGQKNSVGSDFEQLNFIFEQLKPAKRYGICFDTCHAFAAGYDMRKESDVTKTLDKFGKAIGFENLKIVHLNDSKEGLSCNRDRHEHIGLGHIGEKGLSKVIKFMNRKKIPMILETPIDDKGDYLDNLKTVKRIA